ncbi:YciI family protein [Pseudooceanicola sp. LIPI14-2-Ac024]|uniref:YciI family protein n=1 Tax=Pseudooceanicola sp. LIPI14-2-Ac024 TaxID=3344875 RepID=UPI0035D09C71
MPKYLYIYHGDASGVPSTPEEQEAAMKAWGDWMQDVGTAMVEPGEPVGKSKSVTAKGVVDDVANAAFGYSIVEAPDIETACKLAKGNPMVAGGGSVEVAEIIPMPM